MARAERIGAVLATLAVVAGFGALVLLIVAGPGANAARIRRFRSALG